MIPSLGKLFAKPVKIGASIKKPPRVMGGQIMKKQLMLVTTMFILAMCYPLGASADDQDFASGLNAGLIQKYEGEVVDSHTGLMMLNTVTGADNYRKLLVQKMNTALFALSFAERQVEVRPKLLRDVTAISSPRLKTFFIELRGQREKNGWKSSDKAHEEKIQWVIERYVKHGNVYGF